jgi:hypothetical protein
MPFQTHEKLQASQLKNIRYGFFTNEAGTSDGSYLVAGGKTRNVNIYSPSQMRDQGFDPAENVYDNIQRCFTELTAGMDQPFNHKFLMATNYAKDGLKIICCSNLDELTALEITAQTQLAELKLAPEMEPLFRAGDIKALLADALIFKGIPGHLIAAGGISGDAHPIMLVDDEHNIACYLAGTHACLAAGALEQCVDEMIKLGAKQKNIHVLIGPGLGPKSYEFGDNAPAYFGIPAALTEVAGGDKKKYLVNIAHLVSGKLHGRVTPENIHNMDIDTMAFDLYDAKNCRRAAIDFDELNKQGILFFGARRSIKQMADSLAAENSGCHSKVGRHFAGFAFKN